MDDRSLTLGQGHFAIPPQLEGSTGDAFITNALVFTRPKWAPDESVPLCPLCTNRFSTVRRKHHCRQCGGIYCSTCCSAKIAMPHMGYSGTERVCERCKVTIQILITALSNDQDAKYEAANAWVEMCKHTQGVKEVIESGGFHVLVSLTKEKNLKLRSSVLQCFQSCVGFNGVHAFMVQTGIIKALSRVLVDFTSLQTTLVLDILNLLLVFCRDPNFRADVIQDGAMPVILEFSWQTDRPSTPVALRCINHLCELDMGCDIIVNCQDKHYLSKLISLTRDSSPVIQELSFRILANISSGSDYHRQRILQEEVFSGGRLAAVLVNHQLTNLQCLTCVACLMANLAITQNTQGGLLDHLQNLCSLIQDYQGHITLMHHVARGLANFSRFKHNCDFLKSHFPVIVSAFLCSSDSRLTQYGFQISLALLENTPEACISVLQREGMTEFLQCLSERKEALTALQRGVQDRLPEVLNPV